MRTKKSKTGIFDTLIRSKNTVLLFACLLSSEIPVHAQLIVNPEADVEQMLLDFFGPSVMEISNLQTQGDPHWIGTFDGTATDLGLDTGIILATGNAVLAAGPNDLLEVGIFDNNGLPGDADLTEIAGYPSEDACIVEFKFVPASDTIDLRFVFGSDEYPEWVSFDDYNDIFAILLDDVNIALLPDGSAVGVNNVNCFGSNEASYRCNDPVTSDSNVHCDPDFNCPATVAETTLQYDGLTVVLHAVMVLTPGTEHRLKIGIADVSDNGADAGVFLSVSYSPPFIDNLSTVSAKGGIEVFPNPNAGNFSYHLADENIRNISIVDLLGREIEHFETVGKDGDIQLPSSVAPGIYWLVADAGAKEYRIKMVVGL